MPYAQETQNGYEYAAAIQMIQIGMVEEGMAAIQAIRDRYDGEKRNPWNEIECGKQLRAFDGRLCPAQHLCRLQV